MAELGEWNRKGSALSDATAQKEYGVSEDFIVKGIKSGKLEYREGAIWGNPYLRILRSQLEEYIIEQLGSNYLVSKKTQTELRKINKEIADMTKKLSELQARKAEIEESRDSYTV
jgi:coenzyme F420-reducing hydrogenase delta subunit